MSNVTPVSDSLTLDELRLAAAAVTSLLPKYAGATAQHQPNTRRVFCRLKALQLRLFRLEAELAGDNDRIEAEVTL